MTYEKIKGQLNDKGVKLVRAVYAGPDGVVRGKAFLPRHWDEVMESGVGLTQAQLSVNVFDQLPAESAYQPVGEVRIRPDVSTLELLTYLPGHARMLSDLETLTGEPWELCPRSALKRTIQKLADRHMTVKAAFENEFTVYKTDDSGHWQPIDDLNCFSSAAMDVASPYVLPIIEELLAQGIEVEKYFPEAGRGQQEIPVRCQSGIGAADQQVSFRETVRGVATARGFRVSFMPKPHPDSAGNGCHVHVSLWDAQQKRNLFYDAAGPYALSETARRFIAGILHHTPALMALTAPTTNSYKRFVERCWSSSCVCWGPDNREATVRVASTYRGREEESLNIEYKPCDPTCNPYVALAAILLAGLDGVDQKREPGEATLTDPALLSSEKRLGLGLKDYPGELAAALSALDANQVLRTGLGDELVSDYLTMKRAEITEVESRGADGEQQAYLFRF